MITPLIHFQGNCDEAISFYKEALGAEVKGINYAKDAPPNSGLDDLPPNFVMHSDVIICGMTFSMTDGNENSLPYGSFGFLIRYQTADDVRATFEKLAVGGNVTDPLAEVFWSELWGEVTDRFGVTWQVMIEQE